MAIEDSDKEPKGPDSTESQPEEKNGESIPVTPPASSPSQTLGATECQIDLYKEKSYRLSKNQFIVAVITLIVLAAYTAIAAYQACQMRKATKATQDAAAAAQSAAKTASNQLELTERPWMKIDFFINQPLEFQPNGDLGVQFHDAMSNVGHSVALNVRLVLEAEPEGKGLWFNEVPKEQEEICETWRQVSSIHIPNQTSQITLFPNDQPWIENGSFVISKAQIDKVKVTGTDGREFITGISIFGCVDYAFSFTDKHHQTGFWYEIMKPTPALGHPRKFNEPIGGSERIYLGSDVPASELGIVRSIFGGFPVD